MKCDELEKWCAWQFSPSTRVYEASEVDAAIAELKDKIQQKDFFWEGCGFAKMGFKNTIAVSEAFDRLEAENAELKKKCEAEKSIGATFSKNGAELARWVEELRKENESLKYSVADLETDLAMATRWRKVSEELPKDGETVLVLLGRTPKTRGFFLTSRYVAGGWTYGEDPQGCKPTHWFRIPKAPEVK